MSLISFSNVTKYYSLDLILDHVTFSINKGEKVALVGSNGTGKTTLFKLILKKEFPTLVAKEDKPGDISILSDIRIGYLNQNAIEDINHTVKEELFLAFKEITKKLDEFNALTTSLAAKSDEKTLEKYNTLLDYLNEVNAFNLDNKIEEYLSRFRFDKDYLNVKIASLSGGERMKIAFIKLLLVDYDVLLLDEPTNHLDIATIEWLEEYLKSYKGTILFISHDRYFLETLATKVLDLENHKITTYSMGYQEYLKEQEELRKAAKDRVHKLEKLEKNHIDKPIKENKNIKFKIEGSNLKNKGLLDLKDVSAGYDNKSLFKPFSFTLYGKDHLAIVGDNGIGKTTLIKTILGEIPAITGEIKHLRTLKIGYIKQNDYEFVSKDTCLDYLRNKYPTKLDGELRTALGRFLFKKEDVFKNCTNLSNGERMRLVLCDLSLSDYDVLILDEPTNHLDLVTKECLLDALKSYRGAIIFISHDRYFINSLADYILYISKEETLLIEGSYEDLKATLDNKDLVNENKETKVNEPKTLVYDKLETKKKLSNNKINELKTEAKEIEDRLNEIDELLEADFEDYTEIDLLTDEKSALEERYFEILDLLND